MTPEHHSNFVAKIVARGASYQASYEIKDDPAGAATVDQGVSVFTTIGEARAWLDEQAERLGIRDFHIDEQAVVMPTAIDHPSHP